MRAVPFRVVCLLGLNDGDYPRSGPLPSFDLIGAAPRPGDRSRRKDDRYLFLEALLSAREVFYLSYLGRSVRDGSRLLPSVLISELGEYLEKRLPGYPGPLIQHPLQPFSVGYFGDQSKLFSYSEGNLRAARALVGPKREEVLAPELLPEPPASFRQVDLADLAAFFRNPASFFCRRRLGLHLERAGGELPDSENFSLEGLTRFQLGSGILERMINGRGVARDYLGEARRSGELPHGSVGQAAFAKLIGDVEAVAAKLPPTVAGQESVRLEGELNLGGFVLSGRVELFGGLGQLRYRFAKVKAADLCDGWLHHLFLQAVTSGGTPVGSFVVGTDKVFTFGQVADAQGILAGLLDLYWYGLRQPLPLFPETSREYRERLGRGEPHSVALAQALKKWEGDERAAGEGEEPYLQLCYRGQNPLGAKFVDIAGVFWAPLLENCHG
jgi:exodeoxyribonuclease V gamma subunit